MTKPSNKIPMIGFQSGRLTVISSTEKRTSAGTVIYLCLCECGNKTEKSGTYLRNGTSTSCGCLTKELQSKNGKTSSTTHGATRNNSMTGAYKSWITMRRRCFDKNFKDYKRYGGKGITVCDEWSEFSNFLSDMGDRPKGKTLDRIDNAEGYNPKNCRWAGHKTQMNNTSMNRIISYEGESHTVAEWADILGMPRARLSARINGLGWSIKKSFTELTPSESTKF